MKNTNYSKKYLVETGIGLQKVDNLSNSKYFLDLKNKYIAGKINIEQLSSFIQSYYQTKESENDSECKEADIVTTKIVNILIDDNFTFNFEGYLAIHKMLFADVFSHAGQIRNFNFKKEEWVLNGDTVRYGDYREIADTLKYDLDQERHFNYSNMNNEQIIQHLALFISNLWQIHAFAEGNTRTTAVFLIKYLRTLGFDVANELFAKYSLYFRNALVRANFKNLPKGIYEDNSFLIMFLKNLILHENNELSNRLLHIDNVLAKQTTSLTKNEELIVKYITLNPKITIKLLSSKLNLSQKTIKNCLANLKKKKVLIRAGGRKLGKWEMNKAN